MLHTSWWSNFTEFSKDIMWLLIFLAVRSTERASWPLQIILSALWSVIASESILKRSTFPNFSGVVYAPRLSLQCCLLHTQHVQQSSTLCVSLHFQPMATIIADLSTCKSSLPWDVGVFSSISTLWAGLSSTHATQHYFLPENHEILGPALPYFGMTFLSERWCDLAFSGLHSSL